MASRASLASATSPRISALGTPRLASLTPDPEGDPHIPDSIPPWVHLTAQDDAPPQLPEPTRPATRHWKPPPPQHHRPGKKWDHLRSAEAALISSPIAEHQQQWKPFMHSGPDTKYEADTEGARLMGRQWASENMPITQRQWTEDDEVRVNKSEDDDGIWLLWFLSTEKRERTVRVFWRLMLKNPFIPLLFRITIMAFAATSLGISATIYTQVKSVNTDSDPNNDCSTRPSTDMAIIVGSIALPYIGYITWDEYTAKPLGLRSAFAKTSLLLVDLYFVIFSASNLSLAFDALYDRRWACYPDQYIPATDMDAQLTGTCPMNPGICYKQKALTSVLFLQLVAWLVTFSISVMRVVEKLRV